MGDLQGHPFRGNQWKDVGSSLRAAAAAAGPNAEVAVLTDLSGHELTTRTLGLDEAVEFPKHPAERDKKAELVHHHTHPFDSPPGESDVRETARRPGIKKAVIHAPGATYELEILNHERVAREVRDAYASAHVRRLEGWVERGDKVPSREQHYHDTSTEALNHLQNLGLLRWHKETR